MSKIAALTTYITGLNMVAAEQIYPNVDDLVITPCNRVAENAQQRVIFEKHYTATFFIERYPHGTVSENLLFAQVSAWLLENDADRTEGLEFDVIPDATDNAVANIEFGIPFTELILIEEDPDGLILIDGVAYSLL